MAVFVGIFEPVVTAGWSARFWPTPGSSTSVLMPCDASAPAAPTPDTNMRAGVPTAPAHSTTCPPAEGSTEARRWTPL